MQKSKKKADSKAGIALVTGATSGIGRRIVEELLKRKYEVRVVLRSHPSHDPEWKMLLGGSSVYIADIGRSDEDTMSKLMEACRGVGLLFHFAAATSNATSRYNEMINTNVVGTENVLRAYMDANPGSDNLQVMYSSSVTVYGYNRQGEILTEDSELMPKSAYSESKYMAEEIIKAFAEANRHLTYTIFRIGVIYGGSYRQGFTHIFRMVKEGRIRYVGDGSNHLTLVNIDDVVSAIMLAVHNTKARNRIYNLTDGMGHTQKELLNKAAKFLKADAPSKSIHPLLARIGARTRGINMDQFRFLTSDRIVSIERIRRELGFRPAISIDTGGKRLAEEFLQTYRKG